MATVYAVDVNVNLLNAGAGGFGGGTLNVGLMAQLNQQFTFLQTNITRTQNASQKLLGVWSQLFVARELTRFGEAGLTAFGGLIQSAADLQTSLGNIQMATGASREAMDELGKSIIRVSQTHTMSLADTAQMVATASKGGIKDPRQLLALLDPSQAGIHEAGIADFADVMAVSQKMSVDESAKLGMEFATLLGGQGPVPVLKALNQFTRASQFSPEGPQALFETFKKLHATGSKLGATTEQELQISALLGQAGLEGAGGRETASALLRIATGQGIKRGQTGESHALDKMLNAQRNADGGIDLIKMVHALSAFEQQHPKTALTTEREAFGMVGLRALGVLADPKHIAQLDQMVAQWDKIPSLQEQHASLMDQVNAQLKVTTTDFHDLGTVLGTDLLPKVTASLKAFNAGLEQLTSFLQAHPELRNAAGHALTAGAGLSGLGVLGGGALGLAAFMKMAGMAAGGEAAVVGGGLAATIATVAAFALPLAAGVLLGSEGMSALIEHHILSQAVRARPPTPAEAAALAAEDAAMHVHVAGDLNVHANDTHEMHKELVKHLSRGHSKGLWQGAGPHQTPTTGAGSR